MKTPRHGWSWVCGRAIGAALLLLASSLSLPAYATNYYVDEAVGNNSYDGLSDMVGGGDGPKFNVSAAISVATGGSTIEVDTGDYSETLWDSGGNSLTLNPQNYVNVCGADLCGADTVGDGIPDWWRLEYFGTPTTTNSSSCAACDADASGYSNLAEYQSGGDPTNFAGQPPNNMPAAACFTNRYAIYGTNFITILPWTSQGIFYQGDPVTISNSLGTTIEVYDFHCNKITNASPPVTLTNLAMGHYFVQVDGNTASSGFGDRSQFSVWPQGYTNYLHSDIGENPTATYAESNRLARLSPGWSRLQVGWGNEINVAFAGTNDWTYIDPFVNGGGPGYNGRWADGDLGCSNGCSTNTAVPNPPGIKVLNIPAGHENTLSNIQAGCDCWSSPAVDETNTLSSFIEDYSLLWSNVALRYTNSIVYEVLNEPNSENMVFTEDVYSNVDNGGYPASLIVSGSVRAIKYVCPECIVWAPSANLIENFGLFTFTNSYEIAGYSNVNTLTFHSNHAFIGPVDNTLFYTNPFPGVIGNYSPWLATDSNNLIVASLYNKLVGGMVQSNTFASPEQYPNSPDPLGKTNSWWIAFPNSTETFGSGPTSVPQASWNWYTMTMRWWKVLIEYRASGVLGVQHFVGLSDQDIDQLHPAGSNGGPAGGDSTVGWDSNGELTDILGCGPRPLVDGQAMVSWWLHNSTLVTNWLSGTPLLDYNPSLDYIGTPGLHFYEWQFSDGSTNTIVWSDEQITVTTNFGVGLTDIWSNQWTGPIGIEPVIAWGWPQH